MNRDFNSETEKAQRELDETLKAMEEVKGRYIAQATEFLRSWFWSEFERIAKGNTTVTANIGKQKLAELKAAVREHQEKADDVVPIFFQSKLLWWPEKRDYRSSSYSYHDPKCHAHAMQLAAGTLAPILAPHGYLSRDSKGRDAWIEPDGERPYQSKINGRPFCPNGLNWPVELTSTLEEYAKLCAVASQHESELRKIERDKTAKQAEDLWNETE